MPLFLEVSKKKINFLRTVFIFYHFCSLFYHALEKLFRDHKDDLVKIQFKKILSDLYIACSIYLNHSFYNLLNQTNQKYA